MKKKFINALLELAREGTGCEIQHNRCPCNTCFHAWAIEKLGLDARLAHALWLIALSMRGDCKNGDLTEAIADL
jgi:hypothetical protein